MEASGQTDALAALLPEKEPSVRIGQEVGWPSKPVWMRWRGENIPSLRLLCIEPRSSIL
jgi:hypothetical protein